MDQFEKFFNRTLRFLSFRPRSEKEVLTFLRGKRIDKKTIEKIIDRLKELNFINDADFVSWWIEQRQGRKPKGMRVIKMELKQKGIDSEKSEDLVEKPEEEYRLAKKSVEKKVAHYKNLPKLEFKQKLSQFLARQGFDWNTIGKVVDEITKKEYNTS